jgi:lipopolysaccharide/colanic/teichoic acid biosynthesis glycosyltransferase
VSRAKRLLDIIIAGVALVVTLPLWVLAAVGIKLTSAGPVFYRARRVALDRRRVRVDRRAGERGSERRRHDGYHGREFVMYKFRTMHVSANSGASITATNDLRVFPFGAFLRATKIDELPQLVNVLKGDMTLVGPRPEAPEIVRDHYSPEDLATLKVPPGVTSPGTVYYYTHCESTLATATAEDHYIRRLLPVKLALDRVYIARGHALYDIRVILRTVVAIVARMLGIRRFPSPVELAEADVKGPSAEHEVDTRSAVGVQADSRHHAPPKGTS